LSISVYQREGVKQSNENARELWMKVAEQGIEQAILICPNNLTKLKEEEQHPRSF